MTKWSGLYRLAWEMLDGCQLKKHVLNAATYLVLRVEKQVRISPTSHYLA